MLSITPFFVWKKKKKETQNPTFNIWDHTCRNKCARLLLSHANQGWPGICPCALVTRRRVSVSYTYMAGDTKLSPREMLAASGSWPEDSKSLPLSRTGAAPPFRAPVVSSSRFCKRKVGSGGNVYSLEELLRREGLKFVICIFFVRTGNVETQTDSRGTQHTAAPGVKLSKQRSEPAAGRLRLICCMLVSWKLDVCRLPRRAPRLWARSRPLLCWGGLSPSLRGAPTACAATKQRENNRNRTN